MCLDVFPAVVGLLTNRPRLETHPPRHLDGNRRLRLQFERAPDDEHDDARNMLSSVFATKQYTLRLIGASGWVFYLNGTLLGDQSNLSALLRVSPALPKHEPKSK
jgi:hypothetical protein